MMTVVLEGGPFHGRPYDLPGDRYPEAFRPYPNDGDGVYYRTQTMINGHPLYEWSDL